MLDLIYEYFDYIMIFISGIAWFFIRHPFLAKMMVASLFYKLITYSVTYIQGLVAPFILENSLFSLAAYFGILDGLSIYLTIVLAGFGMKQVLAFIRT